MAVQIRVSRQGLTRCPECARHIRIAEPWRDTVCPFCDMSLAESIERACGDKECAAQRSLGLLSALRALIGGRTSAMAASLVGLTVLTAGCSQDTIAVPLYGIPPPADSGMLPDAEPSSDAGQNADANVAADSGANVDAGEAMDAGSSPDSGAGPDAEITEDSGMPPGPLYGLPPTDAGVEPKDAGSAVDASQEDAEVVDSGDTIPTPLYGISPAPDAG